MASSPSCCICVECDCVVCEREEGICRVFWFCVSWFCASGLVLRLRVLR